MMYCDCTSDEDDVEVDEEDDKAADYHAILSVIMESVKELIEDGMVVDLYYYKGKLYKNCELFFFIPFVKCDGDEADKLCCAYRSRGDKDKQLCRYCQCPTDKTDDPKATYPFKMAKRRFARLNRQTYNKVSTHLYRLRQQAYLVDVPTYKGVCLKRTRSKDMTYAKLHYYYTVIYVITPFLALK